MCTCVIYLFVLFCFRRRRRGPPSMTVPLRHWKRISRRLVCACVCASMYVCASVCVCVCVCVWNLAFNCVMCSCLLFVCYESVLLRGLFLKTELPWVFVCSIWWWDVVCICCAVSPTPTHPPHPPFFSQVCKPVWKKNGLPNLTHPHNLGPFKLHLKTRNICCDSQ